MSKLTVYVRKPDLSRGYLIDDYLSLTLTPKFNDVGGWQIELNNDSQAAQQLRSEDGNGIIVERNNLPLFSGPFEVKKRSWKANSSNTVTFSGVDDNIWLARRLALPTLPWSTNYSDIVTGVDAESALKHFFYGNVGAGADATRVVPGLAMGTNLNRGNVVSEQGRFHTVLELMQRTALHGGGLGFRVYQSGGGLVFDVYEPVDRTDTVIFGPSWGNLESFDYETKAPAANYIYVGGGGEGTARVIAPDGDWASIASWGRREAFRDRRDSSDPTELNQTITEELDKQGEQHSLAIVPAEYQPAAVFTGKKFTPWLLGVDYNVGDQVAVDVDGVRIKDQVVSSEIKVAGPSLTAKPVIGTTKASDPEQPDIFTEVRELRREVKALQTR